MLHPDEAWMMFRRGMLFVRRWGTGRSRFGQLVEVRFDTSGDGPRGKIVPLSVLDYEQVREAHLFEGRFRLPPPPADRAEDVDLNHMGASSWALPCRSRIRKPRRSAA